MKPHFSERHSFKTRVTLFTLGIFVISLWSLSFYASHMLQVDMQRVLGQQQFQAVSFVAAQINNELSDRQAALELIAKEIDAHLIGNPAALQARLEQRPLLQNLFNGGVFATDTQGTAIADVPLSAGRIGTNYLDRESVSVPLKEGKTVIGRPAMGKKLGAPIFSIVAPIRNDAGVVIGTLLGTINLGKPNFLDKITQGQYGQTGGYLLNAPQHQLIVTASDKSRSMQRLPAPGINTMHDRYMLGFEGYGIAVNAAGVDELSAAKAIPVAGWFLAVVMPTAEAFAPINRMQQRMLVATFLLTVLTGALTWWMLQRQLAPMLRTSKALAVLATSRLSVKPLPITRQDEIGAMIGGFNHLLETLAQREMCLTESEERFRHFFEKNSSVMLLIDASSGEIVDANTAAWRYYGYARQQLIGMNITQINTATPECVAKERQAAQREERNYFLFSHRLKSGEVRDVEVYSTPLETPGRSVLFSIVHDVNEKNLTQHALADSEFRWKFAIEGAGNGLWDWNVLTGTVFFSPRWKEMLGFTQDEIGCSLDEWRTRVHPDDLARVMADVQAHLDGKTPAYFNEHRMCCKDGSWKWILDRGLVVARDATGKPLRVIGTHSDITEVHQAEAERCALHEQISQLAYIDPLTRLPNRRLLDDRLGQAMATSKRNGKYGALMFLDLDNFKPLNDTHGHDVGDLLLAEVAKRLTDSVRGADSVARLGGDEFVVLLSELDIDMAISTEEASAVAEKIRDSLAAPYLLTVTRTNEPVVNVEHHCSASIGVVMFVNHEESQIDLMKWADLAMYQAKAAGRNRVQFYMPNMAIAPVCIA
jgi:diguanylate cyclase (GGDEF)-like protein/PAS domain S-box-containing protein